MPLPYFDSDMAIIRKLDDEPNDVSGLTAAELKFEFDRAGEIIKGYINEVLLPGITASNVPVDSLDLLNAGTVQDALSEIWQTVRQGGGSGGDGGGILYSVTQPGGQTVGGVWLKPEGDGCRFYIKGPDGYVELLFHTRASLVEMPGGEPLTETAARVMPKVPGDVQQYTLFPNTMTQDARAALEADSEKMALWEGSRMYITERIPGMISSLEDAQHAIYQLYLQMYYDGKDVPHRATLFFDGFYYDSMRDPSSTADRLYTGGNYCLNNWDVNFYPPSTNGSRNNDIFLGYYNNIRYAGAAQSYQSPGPFRILSLSFRREQSVIGGDQPVELSLYTTDGQGLPVSKEQTLTAFEATFNDNGSYAAWSYTPDQPVVTGGGGFALCLTSPTLGGVSSSQYVLPYTVYLSTVANIGNLSQQPYGGAWGLYGTAATKLALILYGSPVSAPPKWVTKEVVLPRPCAAATVYMTQDAASAGRVLPKMALYDDGETPAPADMVRDTSGDILLPNGQAETCWKVTLPAGKTRARLTIQFDGIHITDKVYAYGCVLGD